MPAGFAVILLGVAALLGLWSAQGLSRSLTALTTDYCLPGARAHEAAPR